MAANKELESFCYAVSHDLRAPLRSIDGFSYALIQDYGDDLDSEAKEFLDRIRGATKRMDELISALLVLSRVTTTPMVPERIDLSALVDVSCALAAQRNGHNPSLQIEPGLEVDGDRKMLKAVIEQLIGNAYKFTAKVEAPEIQFGKLPNEGPYFVRDNGVGFDPGQAGKLFQPFERLHHPREYAGEGIGLATAQRIIRKHGGRIWFESEPGKGATFFFVLS